MQKRNFTIIEILIVVAIIGVLAGVLGSVFVSMAGRAKNEAQANQIKTILHACEQFKQDYGSFPSVDAADGSASSSGTDWIEHNSLAFRLCQDLKDKENNTVANATDDRGDMKTWGGNYLTEADIAASQIDGADLLDLWSNPLAYNFADSSFVGSGTFNSAGNDPSEATKKSWVNSTSLKQMSSNGCFGYTIGNEKFARPGRYFMPPVSYALKGKWLDFEMNQPELWSKGDDGEYKKLQYNKSSNSFDEDEDADNVGGNINVMKVQR